MKAFKQILILLTFSCCNLVFSQSSEQLKDSSYIFWQEGIRLGYNDYKGPSFPNSISVIAEIGLWTALDLPETTAPNVKDQFRFYIAPVFGKSTSHADSNDAALLEVNNIYFDICECCARTARKKLTKLNDSLLPYDNGNVQRLAQ